MKNLLKLIEKHGRLHYLKASIISVLVIIFVIALMLFCGYPLSFTVLCETLVHDYPPTTYLTLNAFGWIIIMLASAVFIWGLWLFFFPGTPSYN
jgi:hypothetical protein